MRAAAAVPAIALLAGAGVALLLGDQHYLIPRIGLVGCALIALWAWRRSRSFALLAAVSMAVFAGGVLLGNDAWQRAWRPTLRVRFDELARAERGQAEKEGRRLPEDDEAFATVTGVLRSDAGPGANGVSLAIEVDHVNARAVAGGVLVTIVGSLAPLQMAEWRAGRRVRMPVQLRRPSRYLDPGVPDEERALARRGITLVGTVKSGALVEVLERGFWWGERVADVRAFARRAIGSAVGRWSRQSGAIVTAIVIGDRAGLDDEVQRRLQEAGTYHVIAISGGNIAILAGLMLGAFRFAGLFGRWAMLAAIAILVAYADLVGGGASVDRATLMAVVYFAGRALDHRASPLNALSVVAALLVATAPLSVADPAFVLTFGATLAILLVGAVIAKQHLRSLPSGARAGVVMCAASVAAEAMLFPVGASVFSRVTFAGLALNLFAIPLMGVAQVAGMVVVPLAVVSTSLAAAAGFVAHLGAAGLVWSADLVRFAPIVTYRLAPPDWTAVASYYGGLAIWWTLWRRRVAVTGSAELRSTRWIRRTAAVVATASAAWMLAEPWRSLVAPGDGRLHVTFLDVGQGDSIFVRFPRGATLLVDTGGLVIPSAFDIGDRVVAPVIRATGVHRLDFMAVTHGDPDHIGGAASVIREFRPREAWEGIPVPRFEPLTRLRLQVQALGARWANVYAGNSIAVDGVEVTVRHPRPADWERQRVRNDDSIVLELRWRGVSVLLTGDIGKSVERTIIDTIPPAPLRVVKVPHHGSHTSSTPEFVQALHPQVAVVSAGRTNHFGHPVPEVLQRYRDAGAEVFRTDQDGAVMVDTDGTSIDVHTFTGRHIGLSARPAFHEDTKDTKGTKS